MFVTRGPRHIDISLLIDGYLVEFLAKKIKTKISSCINKGKKHYVPTALFSLHASI